MGRIKYAIEHTGIPGKWKHNRWACDENPSGGPLRGGKGWKDDPTERYLYPTKAEAQKQLDALMPVFGDSCGGPAAYRVVTVLPEGWSLRGYAVRRDSYCHWWAGPSSNLMCDKVRRAVVPRVEALKFYKQQKPVDASVKLIAIYATQPKPAPAPPIDPNAGLRAAISIVELNAKQSRKRQEETNGGSVFYTLSDCHAENAASYESALYTMRKCLVPDPHASTV